MQHRHELGQVLVEDVVGGDGVTGFVGLSVQERRAVGDREEGDAEARDEEGRGDSGASRVARERGDGEPQGDRAPARRLPEPSQSGEQEAGRQHHRGEDDETGDEQQERARAP